MDAREVGSDQVLDECIKCGAEISEADRFCGHCGADVAKMKEERAKAGAHQEADDQGVAEGGSAECVCIKCGAKNASTNRFCSNCAHPINTPLTATETLAKVKWGAASQQKMAGVLDIIGIVLCLFPWINLNLYVWGQEYSIPGLVQFAWQLSTSASSILGSSYSGSGVESTVTIVCALVGIIWLAVVIFLAVDTYGRFTSKDGYGHDEALGIMGFLAIALIVAGFVFDLSLSTSLGSSSAGGIVSTTIWPWIAAAYGIGASIYLSATSSSKKF